MACQRSRERHDELAGQNTRLLNKLRLLIVLETLSSAKLYSREIIVSS